MRAGRPASLLAAALVVALLCATAAGAARPLRTAIFDPSLTPDAAGATMLNRMHGAGASLVRILAPWSQIAPATPEAKFRASDPRDPGYVWTTVDAEVKAAVANGLQPILDVVSAPTWAAAKGAPGVGYPDTAQLAAFSRAVAQRFNGHTAGLPRVRYWQLWNEPNLNTNLEPQFAGDRPVSPGIYRAMANAFATSVKAVSPSNVVIIGGLAPYGIQSKGEALNTVQSVAPIRFMRELLCITGGKQPRSTCKTKVAFDAFAIHPYTWGGPTHAAYSSEDVAIADLPEVKDVLAAAWRLHRVKAKAAPELWVTEFSWDTNPPDPKSVAIDIQARWAAEALYHMWVDGVAVITWFLIRDQTDGPFQAGLYFAGSSLAADRPKPTLTAFRFPFVAYPKPKGTLVWGRVPGSDARAVLIERKVGSRWQRIAKLDSNRYGVFEAELPQTEHTGFLRARLAGQSARSLAFGLEPVADFRVSPFGT